MLVNDVVICKNFYGSWREGNKSVYVQNMFLPQKRTRTHVIADVILLNFISRSLRSDNFQSFNGEIACYNGFNYRTDNLKVSVKTIYV